MHSYSIGSVHQDITVENQTKIISLQVLPNLEGPLAVIILENSSYQNELVTKISHRKQQKRYLAVHKN